MNILIVDDLEQDRKMLRHTIQKSHSEYKISEASNLSRMYAELAQPCDLLFLDISLSGNENSDNEGLNAIYILKEEYPGLPVCLITGYFKDKIYKFLGDFMTETDQIVDCLDKGTYKSENLLKVYSKAEKYRAQYQEMFEDKRAGEDLLQEELDTKIKKFEEQKALDFEVLEKRVNRLELKEKAYEGDDWAIRLEKENEIKGGYCPNNAPRLCVEIEKLLKSLCENDCQDSSNFYMRTIYITEEHSLRDTTKKMLNEARKIRNSVVHGKKDASYQDALVLLNAFQLLKRLKQKT